MLKKIMKHELIATWRLFIPIYIGMLIVTGVSFLFSQILDVIDNDIFGVLMGFGLVILFLVMMFAIVSPYIFLAMRFYKTTATREAYLTFTLPAKTNTILLAKFLVSFMWVVITVVLWYGCFILMMTGFTGDEFFQMLMEPFLEQGIGALILQLFTFLIGLASSVLTIFAAISLSQLVRDHRVIASVAFYAGIYTVQQVLSLIALVPYMIGEIAGMDSAATDEYIESSVNAYEMTSSLDSETFMIYLIAVIISLVMGVACYFTSKYLLSKKLNLL